MFPDILLNAIDEKSVQKLVPTLFTDKILAHLLKLSSEDRRLRFGYNISDKSIEDYVKRMTATDIVFAVFDMNLDIIAMAHFAQLADGSAELGLSVNETARGQKYGTKLFSRAMLTAKVLGINEIFVQCLAENAAMQHIARKFTMDVETQYGESEGRLPLKSLTASELLQYALTQHLTIYDYAFKKQMSQFIQAKSMINFLGVGNGNGT